MLIMLTLAALHACAAPEEFADAQRWADAKLRGIETVQRVEPGLIVLANNDPVQLNARGGKPMNIAGTQYTRGLYCHAVSKVIVRLPGPAKQFSCVLGVDTNSQTEGGRGSVQFAVSAAGRELYRSPVMREGMAGVPISLDLEGAAELTLEVGDAGDGIACDQSDWADARVTLADGKEVWPGDLPFVEKADLSLRAEPPFSFSYDGKPSAELLKSWPVERSERRLDDNRIELTSTWTDPATGLQVRCVAVQYADFPTVEWTATLKNTGQADTPIISDLQGLDVVFERAPQGEFVLHHHVGSICAQNDFEPIASPLGPKAELSLVQAGGRGSNAIWPYMNLEKPGGGAILVIGWPGQWAASFTRDETTGLLVRAGQELTHFLLHPGEQVRTPLMVLQWYRGEPMVAQNVFRRWMVAHNLPRPGGKLPPPHHAACSSHQFAEMIRADEAGQIEFVDGYLDHGLKLDYWWMDAGWYVNEWGWPNTGTWEVDTKRFPRGLRAITDHAHSRDVKSIVWFEPERVTPGTWLWDNHPEWLLGTDGGNRVLNLGNPDAWQWLTDHIDKVITEQGIDLYRQDHNIDPLGYWRGNDSEDRQGITENKYVVGYLAFWDELLRRHPNMLIDSCASGGRRNDLETLRRAVPLLRSDYIFEPVGQQCHTYGLAMWLPFFGSGFIATDSYSIRSTLCPALNTCWDVRREDLPYEDMRARIAEWRALAPNMILGDFWPLTPYTRDNHQWMAWQFDRPETGEGVLQVFRRGDSFYEAARLYLKGLQAEAVYVLSDADSGAMGERSGKELMEEGLVVEVKGKPEARIIGYRRR